MSVGNNHTITTEGSGGEVFEDALAQMNYLHLPLGAKLRVQLPSALYEEAVSVEVAAITIHICCIIIHH